MQGLQVFNEKGVLVFDGTRKITVVLGTFSLEPGNTISITNEIFTIGTVFIYSAFLGWDRTISYTQNGSTVTFTYVIGPVAKNMTPHPTANVTYGVF